jgi:hypothetical protein
MLLATACLGHGAHCRQLLAESTSSLACCSLACCCGAADLSAWQDRPVMYCQACVPASSMRLRRPIPVDTIMLRLPRLPPFYDALSTLNRVTTSSRPQQPCTDCNASRGYKCCDRLLQSSNGHAKPADMQRNMVPLWLRAYITYIKVVVLLTGVFQILKSTDA